MTFNPERVKPAQEVTFPKKLKIIIYSNLYFDNLRIVKTASP